MRYDVTFIEGKSGKPALFFVHGLGIDKGIWESPDESRILGGKLPLSLILAGKPEPWTEKGGKGVKKRLSFGVPPKRLTTLFHGLRGLGYTVVAWSQQRPSAGIRIAVSELRNIIDIHAKYCSSGIILVGHSRGGLIAREYLREGDPRVRALVTLATPHKGSSMARWAKYLAPLVALLNPLLSDAEKGSLRFAVRRIFEFLQSPAVRELLPGSPFFQCLDDMRIGDVYYLSAGGSNPTLFSLYRSMSKKVQYDKRESFLWGAQKVFSVPDIFERIIPERLYPDEMKSGKGDGLVSIESSRLPWADEHLVCDANHAGILFNKSLNLRVIKALTELE